MITILREGILKLEFAALVLYAIIMIAKKIKLNKLLFNLSFGLYLSLIIAICFFPIEIGKIGEDTLNNFIPFKSIIESITESVRTSTPYGVLVLTDSVMLSIMLLNGIKLFSVSSPIFPISIGKKQIAIIKDK